MVFVFALTACRNQTAPEAGAPVPRRVVSLAPNLTEIVFALGAGERLVGVSQYSDYPPEARGLPRVGGLEVSAEKVVSLRPDLVLATRSGNAPGPVTAIASAGVPVLVVPGESLDDVLEGIRMVADRMGIPEAGARLSARLSRRRQAVRRMATGRRLARTLLLVWPDPPQAAGSGTFLDDLLREAGGENLLAGRPGWPVLSTEYLATAPIEVIVIPDSPETRRVYDRAFAIGSLSRGSAARARVVRVEESVLTRPGPRVFEGLERLARGLAGL